MRSSLCRHVLCAAIGVAIFTACGGSGGGVPNAASSLEAAQNRLGQEAVSVALSGEYIGKFHMNGHGKKVKMFLSQFHSALGGALVNEGKSGGLAGVIAWVVNGHTISGNASNGYCTFSMSGRYKYRRLDGTVSAKGCSGQTGTFTFWHRCYFQDTGSEAVRPESGIKLC